ncbi:mechanosensitive ion channel family protein [Altericroceibacterium xinjiangense]|uniref:mechanosensitive ion channel family protein n=1 Tax=Altericroceibacterium xinjiangense TaxID=762261 RepID=UPI0019D13AB2|nr:mechanosensitive ion channel family protein [Altericroceibacterium xinjiangense]
MNITVAQVRATLEGMVRDFLAMLPLVAAGVVVFLLFWLAAGAVSQLIARRAAKPDSLPGAATAIARLVYILMVSAGVLAGVTVAFPTMTPARLISLLGVGGIAIGFAFKDVFQNLLAGLLILLRQPFRVGDEITTGEHTGTVEAIETRATFLRTYDGRRIIIPNSQVYTEPVEVITAYELLRSEYDVGIGYGDSIAKAKEIALAAMRGVDGVLADPAPDVLTWELAGSSVNLRIRWWTLPKRGGVVQTRDRVLQAVKEALSEAGVDLPFPTQVVLFHDQTEETDGDRTRQREGWPAGENPPEPGRFRVSLERPSAARKQ